MSPVGLARFSTPRDWTSQWSYDEAHSDGAACGRDLPDQPNRLRQAVDILTDWRLRHEFARPNR